MREILFRAKRSDNSEWVEGLLWKKKYNDGNRIFISSFPDKDDNEEVYVVCPESVGQYTGLTDKNGTKIFEGDIIKQTYCLKGSERDIKSVIEYGIEYSYSNVYGVCQRFSDGSGRALLSIGDKNGTVFGEVIGNIHDNPELLESEDTE